MPQKMNSQRLLAYYSQLVTPLCPDVKGLYFLSEGQAIAIYTTKRFSESNMVKRNPLWMKTGPPARVFNGSLALSSVYKRFCSASIY